MGTSRHDLAFTYDDYKTLAASTDDRHELIDGDLYMVPAPTVTHQTVSQNIALRLAQHVRVTACGRMLYAPLDVVLGEGETRSVVQPDILFVSNERARIVTDDEIVGAPDLVVEILSKSTVKRDTGVKKALYARSGVREYWLVDPEAHSIERLSLGPDGYEPATRYASGERLVSAVVPGFELSVDDAFEGARPLL
jgi:Uma2 family endonuclease